MIEADGSRCENLKMKNEDAVVERLRRQTLLRRLALAPTAADTAVGYE